MLGGRGGRGFDAGEQGGVVNYIDRVISTIAGFEYCWVPGVGGFSAFSCTEFKLLIRRWWQHGV